MLELFSIEGFPMQTGFLDHITDILQGIEADGLLKREREIVSPQSGRIQVRDARGTREMINLCANNYLGLANHPEIEMAAKAAIDSHGFGMASVRFICGTQDLHKQLEQTIADFFGTEDTILYAACFDANGGLFEPLLGEEDAIVSDALNHASIIDGVRLCKAARYRYANNDMADLEKQLIAATEAGKRHKIIVTDGVFSMDGTIAQLDKIVALAEQYGALTMIDECHASGFMGATGRGTHEHCGVIGKIDIITGTLGKALGGAMGGFTAGKKEVIETLRQKSRPYLFSNTLAPMIAGASLAVLERISKSTELRDRLMENTAYFRAEIERIGFTIKPGTHPVVPVMLFDAPVAQKFAARMFELGVLLSGFFYPVVPMGQARVRVQLSAAHTREQLDVVLKAFEQAGRELDIIKQQ